VEVLILDYRKHTRPSEASPSQWRKLLTSFHNVKTLRVHNGLVDGISRSLDLGGGLPLGLLPELKELECFGTSDARGALNAFINACQVAGCPVRLFQATCCPQASTTMSPSRTFKP
jgi:hypothetical protein